MRRERGKTLAIIKKVFKKFISLGIDSNKSLLQKTYEESSLEI